jgi:hypothetical protein
MNAFDKHIAHHTCTAHGIEHNANTIAKHGREHWAVGMVETPQADDKSEQAQTVRLRGVRVYRTNPVPMKPKKAQSLRSIARNMYQHGGETNLQH